MLFTAEELPRPAGLTCIVGQVPAIQKVREYAELYRGSGKLPGHILLTGIEGIGKRTIARAFAAEYCGNLTEIVGKDQKKRGDLLGVVTNLSDGDALLVTEVTKVPKGVLDVFALLLREFSCEFVVDKGMFAKKIRVPLKRFTCLATARSVAECPAALCEAYPLVLSLCNYSQTELATICEQLAHRKRLAITRAAALTVARASDGTPHHIQVLVDRVIGLGKTSISEQDLAQVSPVLGFGSRSGSSVSINDTDTLSGIDFEKQIAGLLQAMGFHAELTAVTGNGGIDIVATLDGPLIGGRYLVQCKKFGPSKLVGEPAVRDFYGAVTKDRSAINFILITTSGFTAQALAFVRGLPIELIDGQGLRALLRQYGISEEPGTAPRTLFE